MMLSSTTRNGGRLLLSLANVITMVAPLFADWNDSHIFNERWPRHARFHGVVGLGTAVLLSGFGLVRLWTGTTDSARDVAVAVPVAYWGSFFPAALIKGTGVDDVEHPVALIGGVPANLFYAALTTALAIGGWMLDRRMRA
jgi:hypothetical protein